MKKTKVIIFGDDPTGYTGFGKIVDHLVNSVAEAGGHPIVVSLKVSLEPNYQKAKIVNAAALSDPQGWQTLERILIEEKAKMLISIGDPWDIQGVVALKKQHSFTWIGYTPVDATPYPRYILLAKNPPQYLDTAVLLQAMDRIITYSDFGKKAIRRMLEEAHKHTAQDVPLRPLQRIYLGVDDNFYTPRNKSESRKIFANMVSSKSMLFTCIKVNSQRAGFDSLLNAFALYLEKAGTPLADRSRLYLHTNVEGGDHQIQIIMQRYGLENHLLLNPDIKPGNGLPEKIMQDIHNATDIAVSATRAEGFGLNILEAMSCQVPCIVPDYGGPAEYGQSAVAKIPIAASYHPEFAVTDFKIVDVKKMAQIMLELARDQHKRVRMGKAGRKIAQTMSWEQFKTDWKNLMAEFL